MPGRAGKLCTVCGCVWDRQRMERPCSLAGRRTRCHGACEWLKGILEALAGSGATNTVVAKARGGCCFGRPSDGCDAPYTSECQKYILFAGKALLQDLRLGYLPMSDSRNSRCRNKGHFPGHFIPGTGGHWQCFGSVSGSESGAVKRSHVWGRARLGARRFQPDPIVCTSWIMVLVQPPIASTAFPSHCEH